jgi:hypothetical protein
MGTLVTYICAKCRTAVEADEAMPHNAKPHYVKSTDGSESGAEPVLCLGTGFPTKKNIGTAESFNARVQQVF